MENRGISHIADVRFVKDVGLIGYRCRQSTLSKFSVHVAKVKDRRREHARACVRHANV